jgi:hypothetical protein
MREDSIHNKCSTLVNEKSKQLRTQKHGIFIKIWLKMKILANLRSLLLTIRHSILRIRGWNVKGFGKGNLIMRRHWFVFTQK